MASWRRQPAHGVQNVDWRVVALRRKLPRENDVAVQDGAHGVADGLVEIVAFHQHGEEAGDRSFAKISRPLQHLRQQIEYRRRVAFLAGRLAGGQADLALRHRQACDRIHDQQNVGALVAEVFGHRQRHKAGAHAQRRGPLRGSRTPPRSAGGLPGPVPCSRKARTSRLRSPISAITVTSAELCRDMEPSSVLLPTPLPPKMPMRWPLPHGSRPSMARIPVTRGWVMCSRSSGLPGVPLRGYA